MPYVLKRRTLASRISVPLTEGEFSEARDATAHIAFMLASEETLDMVVKNYVEFEHELLQTTLATALTPPASWPAFKEFIQQFDRRLANLLSTCRLYLDHLCRSVKYHDPVSRDHVKCLTAEQYRDRLGYRVMEELRNHVQHKALATHAVTLDSTNVETPEGSRSLENAKLFLDVPTLEAGRFKKKVLTELAAKGERVEVKPLLRNYVTGVLRIQFGVRKHYSERTARSIECVAGLIKRYREQGDPEANGLAAVELDDSGAEVEIVELSSAHAERLQQLQRKNAYVGELSNIIVSSQ